MRRRDEGACRIAERCERVACPPFHLFQAFPRCIHADQRNERRFACSAILGDRLADERRVTFDIEKIIGKLKGNAERTPIFQKSVAPRVLRARQNRPRLAGEADQRARFHGLKAQYIRFAHLGLMRSEIKHLSACHAAPSHMARKAGYKLAAYSGIGMGGRIGQDFEGKRQKRIARQYCRRLVEGLMRCRAAAPQIIVVHCGQIVVHERITMDAFDRRARVQRRFIRQAAQSGALQSEKGAQAFSASQCGIAHRLIQTSGDSVLLVRHRQPFVEARLYKSCTFMEPLVKGVSIQ